MILSDLIGTNQNLQSYNSKSVKFENDTVMNMQSASQVKSYKRSIFNISCQISGIDKYFSSCFSPNIFEAGIVFNCEGLQIGDKGNFQIKELLEPLKNYFTGSILNRIFQPEQLLLISSTVSKDEDGETTLVNMENGTLDSYKNTFYSKSDQYKIYFPRITRTGYDAEVDQRADLIDVINQSKLYSLSLSCKDKNYTLNATSLA